MCRKLTFLISLVLQLGVVNSTLALVTATNPNPANGATYANTHVRLTWEAGDSAVSHDIYFGENFNDVNNGTGDTFQGRQDSALFQVGLPGLPYPDGLVPGTTYYWRVDEVEADLTTIHKGDIWSFDVGPPTTPNKAHNPDPPDRAILRGTWAILTWEAGGTAVSHDVYMGENFNDVNNGTGDTFQGRRDHASLCVGFPGLPYPDGLVPGTTYYWRADEVEADMTTIHKGDIWSFDVEAPTPQIAHNPDPPDGAILRDTWVSLSWSAGVWAVSHDVYFGEDFNEINNFERRLEDNGTFQGNQADTFLIVGLPGYPYPDGLVPGTTYYWRVDEVEEVEPHESHVVGDLWSFTVRPNRSHNPNPADGAKLIDQNVTLSWTAGFNAKLHTVYFGDNFDVVNNATEGFPQAITTFSPGSLEPNMTYYWRVDEFDGNFTYKGDVWSFTTANPSLIVIDDFDSYSNNIGDRIIDTWADGGGWTSRPPNEDPNIIPNKTGGIVGHDIWSPGTPYTTIMETTIVYSGEQSMPLYYNNMDWPFYSQVDRTFSEPQNWTVDDANTYTLYLHGEAPKLREMPRGGFALSGAGSDIWGTSDEFRFLYKRLKGNGSITARVTSNGQGSNDWTKGGVMIRESLEGGSKHAMVVVTGGGGGGALFLWRRSTDETSSLVRDPIPSVSPPYWVRIERENEKVRGYLSRDGVNWIQQHQAQTVNMDSAVYIGLCVTSHVSGELRTYEFDNIQTAGNVSGQWKIEDVGVEQPGNDPAPIYIAVEDEDGNVAVVNHPDPKATVITSWQRWSIPFSDFIEAGVNLETVMKISIGVGEPNDPKFIRLWALSDNHNPGSRGRVYCDDQGAGTSGTSHGKMEGYLLNILTGKEIKIDKDPDVTLYPINGTGDFSDDYWYLSWYPDGYYWIPLPLGEYTIIVDAEDFLPASPNVRLSPDKAGKIKRNFVLIPEDHQITDPVYCFQLSAPADSCYFYTLDKYMSEKDMRLSESDELLSDPCNWTYKGIAFCAWDSNTPDPTRLKAVSRFVRQGDPHQIPAYAFDATDLEPSFTWILKDKEAFFVYPVDEKGVPVEGAPNDTIKPVCRIWHKYPGYYTYTICGINDKGIVWYAYERPKP